MDSHSGPFFYYLIAVCIGSFPWCVLLGPAIGRLVQSIKQNEPTRAGNTLVACCVCVWIGILSLASTKLPSYIIPCYPALALGFGALVDHWLTASDFAQCRRWLRAAWGTTAIVGVGLLIAIPMITRIYLNGERTPALVGVILLVGATLGLWFSERGRTRSSLAAMAVMSVLFCTGLLAFAVLPIDAHQNSQMLADFTRRHSEGSPHLASHNYLPPSLVYYGRQPIERLSAGKEISEFFQTHPKDAFLVTTDKHYEGLASQLPPDVIVLTRDRRFLKKGQVLLLGRSTPVEVADRQPSRPGRE